tara:strand:+ start:179 stop:496 length:318 start_codon:yes stop_codon:yes gene_type:complete
MSVTSAPTLEDQELVSSGLIESASVNSISDFIPSKFHEKEVIAEKGKDEFINTFICHLIFYTFFCISLVLHILIDLGLGAFIKKSFIQLIDFAKHNFVEHKPAFA